MFTLTSTVLLEYINQTFYPALYASLAQLPKLCWHNRTCICTSEPSIKELDWPSLGQSQIISRDIDHV